MRTTFPTGLGILALTGSLLVGCGGGDEDAATALRDGEAPADDAAEGNPLTRDDDGDRGGDAGEGDALGGDDGGDGGTGAFCAEAAGVERRFAALDDTDVPSGEEFTEVSEAFADLSDDAPDEIADDMETIATALGRLAEVFEGIDIADPESLEALEEEAARLEDELGDLEAAGENVEAYLEEECGVDLGGDAGGEGDAGDDASQEGDGQG